MNARVALFVKILLISQLASSTNQIESSEEVLFVSVSGFSLFNVTKFKEDPNQSQSEGQPSIGFLNELTSYRVSAIGGNVLIYGEFTNWISGTKQNSVGGMLLLDASTSTWQQVNLRSLTATSALAVVPISSTDFYVFGQINATLSNKHKPYNYALCTLSNGCNGPITGSSGLDDINFEYPIVPVVINDTIFLEYRTIDNKIVVVSRAFDKNLSIQWTKILNISVDIDNISGDIDFRRWLFRFQEWFVTYSNDGFVAFDGTVWFPFNMSLPVNIEDFMPCTYGDGYYPSYLIAGAIIKENNVYYEVVFKWDGEEWISLSNQTLIEFYTISDCKLSDNSSYAYVLIQSAWDDVNSTVSYINLETQQQYNIWNNSNLNILDPSPLLSIANDIVWIQWFDELYQFNVRTGKPIFNSIRPPTVYSKSNDPYLCVFGSQSIFAFGTFDYAGLQLLYTPQHYALWNGLRKDWTIPVNIPIQSVQNGHTSFKCSNNGSSLILAYESNTSSFMFSRINELDASVDTRPLNFSCWLTAMAVYGDRVAVACDSTIVIYDWKDNSAVQTKIQGHVSYRTMLFASHNILYVGGYFNSKFNNTLLKLELSNNGSVTDFLHVQQLGDNRSVVESMFIFGNSPSLLYVFGNFSQAGNLAVRNIAACNEDGNWMASNIDSEIDYIMYFPHANICVGIAGFQMLLYNVCETQIGNTVDVPSTVPYGVPYWVAPRDPPIGTSSSSGISNIILVIAGAVTGVFLLSVITIIFYLSLKKRRNRIRYTRLMQDDLSSKPFEVNLQDLVNDSSIIKINEVDLILGAKIGSGGQGVVYKGKWKDQEVAVKTLSMKEGIDDITFSYFIQEIKLLSILDHPNVVKFIGVVIKETENEICLITELMSCELKSVINRLSHVEKLRAILQIAKAMVYLHNQQPPVLHRDLKLSNVLLSKDGVCKVTDFGLSRIKPENTKTITVGVGTLLYVAPEVIEKGKYNEKADVYSFGCMMAELFQGFHPYAHVKTPFSIEFIRQLTSREVEPMFDSKLPETILKITQQCLSLEYNERPSFKQIVKFIKTIN